MTNSHHSSVVDNDDDDVEEDGLRSDDNNNSVSNNNNEEEEYPAAQSEMSIIIITIIIGGLGVVLSIGCIVFHTMSLLSNIELSQIRIALIISSFIFCGIGFVLSVGGLIDKLCRWRHGIAQRGFNNSTIEGFGFSFGSVFATIMILWNTNAYFIYVYVSIGFGVALLIGCTFTTIVHWNQIQQITERIRMEFDDLPYDTSSSIHSH